MAEYKIDYTGDTVNEAIRRALSHQVSIQNLETFVAQHDASITGNTVAIHDLQMDVAALKMSGGGGGGISVVAMTQAQYDAATKDANTLYLIY